MIEQQTEKEVVTTLGDDVPRSLRGNAASDLLTPEEVEAMLRVDDSTQRQDVYSEADIQRIIEYLRNHSADAQGNLH